MQASRMRGGKALKRKSWIAFGAILGFGLAAFGAFRAYRHWEPNFLLREAHEFLVKKTMPVPPSGATGASDKPGER